MRSRILVLVLLVVGVDDVAGVDGAWREGDVWIVSTSQLLIYYPEVEERR